jgi:hypothetical protein
LDRQRLPLRKVVQMKRVLQVVFAMTGLGIVAGGCAMIDRMDGVHEARTLQRTGEPAEAVVIDIWDTGITVNDDPVVGLLVEVQPLDRPAYRTTIPKSLVSRIDVPRFQPGNRVAVSVDRQDPTRVALAMDSSR